MKLSTAKNDQEIKNNVTKLSTRTTRQEHREQISQEFEGVLSKYEQQLMLEIQQAEEKNQMAIEALERRATQLVFNQYPWLTCDRVEFCKSPRRDELVRIYFSDDTGQPPTISTAIEIHRKLVLPDPPPWNIVVEAQWIARQTKQNNTEK